MKIILFDLFDTLIEKTEFDYDKGLTYLAEKYFNSNTSMIFSFAKEFREKYMLNRNATNQEVSFIDQLRFFEDKFNTKISDNIYDVEWDFFVRCRKERIKKNINVLLDYFKSLGYEMSILSNSIFSSKTLKKYLTQFKLMQYFNELFSSADMQVRKPAREAFDYVFNKLKIKPTKEIYYIGNKYETDAVGAINSNITPILINNDIVKYDGLVFSDPLQIKNYFEETFLYINSISDKESLVDGPGLRTVIYFQGCNRGCIGCHNKSTWDISNGKRYSIDDLASLIKDTAKNHKITLSGGEPLIQEKAIVNLVDKLDGFDICLYTGGSINDVSRNLLKKIQYVKVGPFIKEMATSTKPYVGSSNQQLIRIRKDDYETINK